MADRYAVATGNWNSTATWSATSGGAPGASVPSSADDVYLNAASGSITVTFSATGNCRSLDCTGYTGTLAGGNGFNLSGPVFTVSSTMTWTQNASIQFNFNGTVNVTTNGKSLPCAFTVNSTSTTLSLMDALTITNGIFVTFGTFTTNNYAVTATQLSSSNSNARTINLGSSTVTLTSTANTINFSALTNLTFNAGTSLLVLSGSTSEIGVGAAGLSFYNLSSTGTSVGTVTVNGANTFNNLTFSGTTAAGLKIVSLSASQTVSGTLTLSAGTDATMRTFVRSDTIGTTRTLTCAAFSGTDADFRDITIAGAAAPVSGTRLGDAKGNSGITFGAGVTRYWNLAGSNNWSATGWAASSGGSPAVNNFPLAQDTAVFEATSPGTGTTTTINAAYNIGTIDMSARTSNTMTLATGTTTPAIYGNWINGTGTTLTGTGTMTFAGRGSQTITSAGKTFTQGFTVNTPGGSVTLQDAFSSNRNNVGAFTIASGTFDANNYNFTLTGGSSQVGSTSSNVRTIAIGSGTWTLSGITAWNMTNTANLTVTGTGTISLISASSKNFIGGSIQTYPTLNQGGTGTLRVLGSNKFANMTNTAIGRVEFDPGQTNIFTAFNLNGVLGNLLQLGANTAAQTTLQKPTAWQMGLLSFDAGNNTGLNFLASDGTMNYLSVSYINGQVSTPSVTYAGNFFAFF